MEEFGEGQIDVLVMGGSEGEIKDRVGGSGM